LKNYVNKSSIFIIKNYALILDLSKYIGKKQIKTIV
jgi:hypothetical protein